MEQVKFRKGETQAAMRINSQTLLSTILSTQRSRYFLITSWAAALSSLTGVETAAIWWITAMLLGGLRGGFERFIAAREMYGLKIFPFVGMVSGVPWAIAPWLAWKSHSSLGQAIALLMLASGYGLSFTQLGHRPKAAVLVTAPYTVVALMIGASLWGAPQFLEYAIALPLMYGQLLFTVMYGRASQATIQAGLNRQTSLIADLELARDQADAASRAKSAFLGVVGHELRTPMNGVLGAAQLLERTALDAAQADYVAMIRESGNALLMLLNDVLDVTRIEANQLDLECVEIDLPELIHRVRQNWSAAAAEKALRYTVLLNPELPPTVFGDPHRVSQVVENLLSNAIKFTASGEVRLIADFTRPDEDHIALTINVSDTGVGIAAEDTLRLFQPFGQLDTRVTRNFQGMGLGLSISKRLARAMGGDLTVISELGLGAAFTFTVPLRAPRWRADTDPAPAPAPEARPAGLRVLVVEDNPTNRKILEVYLSTLEHSVFTAENGAAALESCEHNKFDLVLMDINMPVMDGLTATRALRGGFAVNRDTPIVMVSASARPEDQAAGLLAGADGYLNKPVDLTSLATMVERAGGGRDAFRQSSAALCACVPPIASVT